MKAARLSKRNEGVLARANVYGLDRSDDRRGLINHKKHRTADGMISLDIASLADKLMSIWTGWLRTKGLLEPQAPGAVRSQAPSYSAKERA